MEIIDLDIALPKDKHVRIDGKVYQLPGDLPVELYLSIQQARKEFGGDDPDEMISRVRDDILQLFQIRNPNLKALPAALGLGQMIDIIAKIYGGEEPPVEERPSRPRGTRSSKTPPAGR